MDIKQVREEKEKLEKAIGEMLMKFNAETGVMVIGLELLPLNSRRHYAKLPGMEGYKVTAVVEM